MAPSGPPLWLGRAAVRPERRARERAVRPQRRHGGRAVRTDRGARERAEGAREAAVSTAVRTDRRAREAAVSTAVRTDRRAREAAERAREAPVAAVPPLLAARSKTTRQNHKSPLATPYLLNTTPGIAEALERAARLGCRTSAPPRPVPPTPKTQRHSGRRYDMAQTLNPPAASRPQVHGKLRTRRSPPGRSSRRTRRPSQSGPQRSLFLLLRRGSSPERSTPQRAKVPTAPPVRSPPQQTRASSRNCIRRLAD